MASLVGGAPPHPIPNFRVDPNWGLVEDRAKEILLMDDPNHLKPPQATSTTTFPSRLRSLLPASLIAVVSSTLAIACQDFAKRNTLIRRMGCCGDTVGGFSDHMPYLHDNSSDEIGTMVVGNMVFRTV